MVWLRVSHLKGVMRFRNKGRLNPRYIGPFEILGRAGEVAYRFSLPPNLSLVYHVFHVSMLQHYISDESYVISINLVELSPNLTYEEKLMAILNRQIRKLRTKEITLIKV